MAVNKVGTIDDRVKLKTVLVSVFDKSGLDALARGLLRMNPGILILSTGGTYSALLAILGDSADRHAAPGLRIHRPARDAGRAGEDPRLQDLPRAPFRDLQRRARGGPRTDRRRGDRHGRGQPLPLRADHCPVRARLWKMRGPTSTSADRAWCAPPRRTSTGWPCSRIPRTTPPWWKSSAKQNGALCLATRYRLAQKAFRLIARYDDDDRRLPGSTAPCRSARHLHHQERCLTA